MAFFMKTMISNQVKNLGFGGGSEEKKEEGGTSDPAAAQGMTREEYEEYQKQMIEENSNPKFPEKRFHLPSSVQAKAAEGGALCTDCTPSNTLLWAAEREGALVGFADIPKASASSEMDDNQIQMAGDDVDLPEDLRKMVDEDQEEEEDKDSILGQLQNLQNMDLDTIKEKAQATFTEIKQTAEQKCSVM
ncbi:Complexin-4 [Pteropus alecto]|uniref:Complexin-4 n=1 Tax=Pteropus alecto TaxID=9402 RepID=L5KJY7_PTEAL|nr:Complexin-4 [Pteropus alecto]